MSKLVTVIALVFAATSASAGFFDKFGGTPSWEDIHNGPYILEMVQHPNGLNLFNACYDGAGHFMSIDDVSVPACTSPDDYSYAYDQSEVYDKIIVTGSLADKAYLYELSQRYPVYVQRICGKWAKKGAKVHATKKVCTKWGLEEYNDNDGDGIEYRSVCVGTEEGKYATVAFPLTQAISVWSDNDQFDGPFIQDGDTPAFTKDYTIPSCEANVEPVPGKKM